MPLLFAAVCLPPDQWAKLPFDRRVTLIRSHYELDVWPNIHEYQWYFPEAGIGVFVAYQTQERKFFHHASLTDHGADFLTHPPFGYRSLVPSARQERMPTELARVIDENPSNLLTLNPPQGILSIDERSQTVRFRNDLIGLGKTFLLRTEAGTAISNRPVAAHLLSGISPEASEEGWAAEQLHGWFLGELSPFKNTRRLPGGTIISMDRKGIDETRHDLAGRWFTERMARSSIAGFDNFLSEFSTFAEPSTIDIALSGGRDSRASAAIASSAYLERVRFRTNEPPALEGIVARQLIERLPNFKSFRVNGTVAVDSVGHPIWKANIPKIVEVEVHSRAKEWARIGEGIVASASIYANPPKGSLFVPFTEFFPTFSGVAGESAKAYYWSQRMVSGAYARNLRHFQQDIKIPINERLKTHPLTTQSAFPFINPEFRDIMRSLIRESQDEATGFGIHGYRFLDYWWFTNRFGAGTTVAYSGTTTFMPFLVPEYISEALQRPPLERAQSGFLSDIVRHYRPEWTGVPYFDELQNSAPPEQVRYYRDRSLLWEGDLATDFMSMLRDSAAFSHPYDREAMVSFFESDTIAPNQKAGLNLKALGLVHRHAFHEMCNSICRILAAARAK